MITLPRPAWLVLPRRRAAATRRRFDFVAGLMVLAAIGLALFAGLLSSYLPMMFSGLALGRGGLAWFDFYEGWFIVMQGLALLVGLLALPRFPRLGLVLLALLVSSLLPMVVSGLSLERRPLEGFSHFWPWIIALLLMVMPAVLLASVRLPMVGLVVSLLFIFEVVPTALQPRLPFGGGRLQIHDVLLMFLAAVVLIRAWIDHAAPLKSMGPMRWPLYYLAACIISSLIYVRYFAPNTLALGEARVVIGWLIVPIMVLAVATPQAYRWMLRVVVAMGIVIALYVSIQSLFEVRIMTGARVELLDKDLNSDVVRSIAGGGVYLIIFALFLVINRVLERKFAWWWAVPAALLLVFGIAVQFGRGVWLSTAAGLLVSAALFRGFGGVLRVLLAGAVTVALMLSAAAVFKPRLAEAVVERAVGIGSEIQTGGSFNWRRMENQAALDRIVRNPVFGVGLGGQYKQTASSEGHFGIEGTYIHNGYLFFPLKMGLVASFVPMAFMLAFVLTLRQGVRQHHEDPDSGLVAALAGAFTVPCIASYTQPEWADPRGIAAFAIFTGLALLFRRFGAVRPAAAEQAATATP